MKLIDDLCKTPDGSWSITKLAAATAHLSMAIAFIKITWGAGYVADLWITYGGFAILHAVTDKAMSKFADFKNAQLGTPPA